MNIFTRLRATFTTAEDAEHHIYECKTCSARFALQRQVCPECGGYNLDRLNWSSYDY